MATKFFWPHRPYSGRICLFPRFLGLKKGSKCTPWGQNSKKKSILPISHEPEFGGPVIYAKYLIFGKKNLKLTNFKNILFQKNFSKKSGKSIFFSFKRWKIFFKIFQMAIISIYNCTKATKILAMDLHTPQVHYIQLNSHLKNFEKKVFLRVTFVNEVRTAKFWKKILKIKVSSKSFKWLFSWI